MADREDYERLKDRIHAIPGEKTKKLGMPVAALSQESEMLYNWVQEDEEKFLNAKFNWNLVKSLPARTGAARYTEAVWRNMRLRQEDAQKIWVTEREKGYEMREELLAAMDLAFDEDEDLLQRLSEIREGESHADMVTDVGALAELAREQKALMEAIGFDMQIAEQAAQLADRLARLLGEADADRLEDAEEKKIRDKAYTYLSTAVRKIRKCGKYVCRHEPERLKGYTSEYIASASRRYRQKQKEQAETTQPAE
jgi:hypothetical protein